MNSGLKDAIAWMFLCLLRFAHIPHPPPLQHFEVFEQGNCFLTKYRTLKHNTYVLCSVVFYCAAEIFLLKQETLAAALFKRSKNVCKDALA